MAHYENGKQKRTKTRKEKTKESKSLVVNHQLIRELAAIFHPKGWQIAAVTYQWVVGTLQIPWPAPLENVERWWCACFLTPKHTHSFSFSAHPPFLELSSTETNQVL
jgi:hypothetical protein